MNSASPLKFPCDFPIKAMGRSGAEFRRLVTDIVSRHAPDLDVRTLRVQESRQGRCQSVTLTVHAQSRAQLDAIYRELTAHEQVMIAL